MKNIAILPLLFFLALLLFCGVVPGDATPQEAADLVEENQPLDINSQPYQQLFSDLQQQYNFSAQELIPLFTGLTIDRDVLRLMDKQWGKPLPWYKYRKRFITPGIIKKGKSYLQKYRPLFDRIEQEFGVNREAVVAIWAIETRYGGNCGSFNMFRSLNTLFAAYPRRSDFFREELIQYLLLCRENGLDPKGVLGSYAGAFGQAQFMPSSYRKYAVDYDGDQRSDLLHSRPDVLASIANYLKSFGWQLNTPTIVEIGSELKSAQLIATSLRGWKGRIDWQTVARDQNRVIPRPPGDLPLNITCLELVPPPGKKRCLAGYPNYQAILHYNHSQKYATVVSELAAAFAR